MEFTLEIECNNAAFDDENLTHEIARILRKAADQVELENESSRALRDINGNIVGQFAATED